MIPPGSVPPSWIAAGVGGVVAVAAGLAERRRGRRADPDAVGWVDWRTVQMAAMLATAVALGLAFAH